jgi:hypothetical protein
MDLTAFQIDSAPPKAAQLAEAHAGEDRGDNERPPSANRVFNERV